MANAGDENSVKAISNATAVGIYSLSAILLLLLYDNSAIVNFIARNITPISISLKMHLLLMQASALNCIAG